MTPEVPIEAFELFATNVDHPECVAFDRSGNLWAGGEAGQIYRISPEGKVELITSLGGFCAGVAFSPQKHAAARESQDYIVLVVVLVLVLETSDFSAKGASFLSPGQRPGEEFQKCCAV